MSYHEIKLDTFLEYFNKELKLYDKFGGIRDSWKPESIPKVQNMSPEIMVLAFAYISKVIPITKSRYTAAAKLYDESSEINQIPKGDIMNKINDINSEMEKMKFDSDVDLEIALSIYTVNIDDKILTNILKDRRGDKVPELNNWPFKENRTKNTKIKLKMELSAYITNILKSYGK